MERIGDIDIADLLPDARQAVAQQDLSADEWFDKQRRVPARKIVVPTVSDFVFPATRGMTAHAVVTPYVVSDTGVVSKPPSTGGRDTARLVWELTDINLDRSSPDESKHQVTGRLTAKRGATQIWTRMVQAPASDDVEALKKTSYTVIGS